MPQDLTADRIFFNEMHRAYHKKVFQLILRGTNDWDAAEDIEQEVFLTLFFKVSTVRNHAEPAAWLYNVARKLIKRYWREESKRREYEVSLEYADQIPDPGDELLAIEDRSDLFSHTLTPKERQMLYLRYSELMPLSEIADRCGVTYGTCRVYMSKAVGKLKSCYGIG